MGKKVLMGKVLDKEFKFQAKQNSKIKNIYGK